MFLTVELNSGNPYGKQAVTLSSAALMERVYESKELFLLMEDRIKECVEPGTGMLDQKFLDSLDALIERALQSEIDNLQG